MVRELEKLSLHRLRVPLFVPYRLAFGPVEYYDTIIVVAVGDDGAAGFGEATILTGYTDETIADSWEAAKRLGNDIAGQDIAHAWAATKRVGERLPFTGTAFSTALEMLRGSPILRVEARVRVPLLGLISGKDEAALEAECDALLQQGYRTFKVKVGFDVDKDSRYVSLVQRVVGDRARIRIDANQGFGEADAVKFVKALDPRGIELFEQPCEAGDWDAHLAVVRASPVPMMLDESIYGLADIERAAELKAAAYIKLKLMKFVTLEDTVSAIDFIKGHGMVPVFGNGVACDIGCWMEACIAARHIDNAGEMNGFLKARASLLQPALAIEGDSIVLDPAYRPAFDIHAVAAYVVESVECMSASGAARQAVHLAN